LRGAWRAILNLRRSSSQSIYAHVEFLDPDGNAKAGASGHFPRYLLPPNVDAPVLQVRAAKMPFSVGDTLDMRVTVLRPSHLFCWILDQDAEATLFYPQYETQNRDNQFGPEDGEIQFQNYDPVRTGASPGTTIGMLKQIPLHTPADELFSCVATGQPLPDDLRKRWFTNTLGYRREHNKHHQDKMPDALKPGEIADLLSRLRQIDGYAGASARIVVR
jgi:hypothetical protein